MDDSSTLLRMYFFKCLLKAGVSILSIYYPSAFSPSISIACIVFLGSFILIFFWCIYYAVRFSFFWVTMLFTFSAGIKNFFMICPQPCHAFFFFFYLSCILQGVPRQILYSQHFIQMCFSFHFFFKILLSMRPERLSYLVPGLLCHKHYLLLLKQVENTPLI